MNEIFEDGGMLVRLLHDLPDAVTIIDADGRLEWANQRAEKMFGLCIADSVGTSGLDLVHPDDLELVLRSLVTNQGREVGAPIEMRLRTTTGWRLMEALGASIPWLREGAVLLTIRDLTQRRRHELAHNQDSRLRSLVQNSTAITMLVSADGCVESASDALTRILGHDPEMVEGIPLAELVTDDDLPLLQGAFERASRGSSVAGPVTATVSMRRHGKGTIPLELAIVNLVDDPTVGGYVVTGHDVTDRRSADYELGKALSLVTAALDATNEGILVLDNADHVVTFNRRFVKMWGLTESIVAANDRASLREHVLAQLADPEAIFHEGDWVKKEPGRESHDVIELLDGRVIERMSIPQIVDGKEIGRVWSFRDVNERGSTVHSTPPQGAELHLRF